MQKHKFILFFFILVFLACTKERKTEVEKPVSQTTIVADEIVDSVKEREKEAKEEAENIKEHGFVVKDFDRPSCDTSSAKRWTYKAYPSKAKVDQVFIDPHNSKVYWAHKRTLPIADTMTRSVRRQAFQYEIEAENGIRLLLRPGEQIFHIEKDFLFTQKSSIVEEYQRGPLWARKYKIDQNRTLLIDSLNYEPEENPWDWQGPEVFLPAARIPMFSKRGDFILELVYKKLKSGTRVKVTDIGKCTLIDLRSKDTTVFSLAIPENLDIDWGNMGGPQAVFLLESEMLIYVSTITDRFSHRLLSFDLNGRFMWQIPIDYMDVPWKSRVPLKVIDDPQNNQAILCNRIRGKNEASLNTVGAIDKQDGSFIWRQQIYPDTAWKSPVSADEIEGHGNQVLEVFRIDAHRIGLIYAQLTSKIKDRNSILLRGGRLLILNTAGEILCEQTMSQPFRFIKTRVKNGRIEIYTESGKWTLE